MEEGASLETCQTHSQTHPLGGWFFLFIKITQACDKKTKSQQIAYR